MDENQMLKEAKKLAMHECPSHANGYCLEKDQPCSAILQQYAIHDGAIGCDYFLTAVLPQDEELNAAIWSCIKCDTFAPWVTPWTLKEPQKSVVKTCATCGKHFVPSNNRQKFCTACAVEAERKRNAKSHRARYWDRPT